MLCRKCPHISQTLCFNLAIEVSTLQLLNQAKDTGSTLKCPFVLPHFFVRFFSQLSGWQTTFNDQSSCIYYCGPIQQNSYSNIKLFENIRDFKILASFCKEQKEKEEKSESPLLGNAFYCSALLCFLHLVCKKVGFYSLAPLLCCLLFSISNCWDISCKSWETSTINKGLVETAEKQHFLPELLSSAAVDCSSSIGFWSQKHHVLFLFRCKLADNHFLAESLKVLFFQKPKFGLISTIFEFSR